MKYLANPEGFATFELSHCFEGHAQITLQWKCCTSRETHSPGTWIVIVGWRICVWDITHSHVRHDSCMWDMTRSRETRLIFWIRKTWIVIIGCRPHPAVPLFDTAYRVPGNAWGGSQLVCALCQCEQTSAYVRAAKSIVFLSVFLSFSENGVSNVCW